MAVAVDGLGTAATGVAATGFTTVGSLTVGAGANRVAIVFIQWGGNPGTITSVKWNSGPQTMTQIGSLVSEVGGASFNGIFGLIAPASATSTFTAAWTNSVSWTMCGMSFTGADQGSVAGTFRNIVSGNPSTGSGAGASYPPTGGATINCAAGDFCVLGSSSNNQVWLTTGGIGTNLYALNTNVSGAGRYITGAGASTAIATTSQATAFAACYIGCDIAAVGTVGGVAPRLGITPGRLWVPGWSGPTRGFTPTLAFPPSGVVLSAVGSASGSSTVSGVGASLFSAVGTATGVAAVSGVGASLFNSVGSADGTSTVNGVGAGLFNSVGSAAGTCTVNGVGAGLFNSVGNIAGIATVNGVGHSLFNSVGNAAGISTVNGVGTSSSAGQGVGVAAGLATVNGIGASLFASIGSVAGFSTVLGVGFSSGAISAVGMASGFATVIGVGSFIPPVSTSGEYFALSDLYMPDGTYIEAGSIFTGPPGWIPSAAVDPRDENAIQAYWNLGPVTMTNAEISIAKDPWGLWDRRTGQVTRPVIYWKPYPAGGFILTGAGAALGPRS